jgi:DNA-binding response OmpR family regulator
MAMVIPHSSDRLGPRVLVIEDDETLAFLLQEALRNEGFEVYTAGAPMPGLHLHQQERMDLIILDLSFPGADGLTTLRELRAVGDVVPVIILTARGNLEDRVKGLGEGADDYISKPFSIVELQARVRALLRRMSRQVPAPTDSSMHGPFTLHWSQMRVEREGQTLDLTPQEFRILTLLIRFAGRPLSRSELLAFGWPTSSRPASPRTVDVYVARLRSKLGRPTDPSWILTAGGEGYSWNG